MRGFLSFLISVLFGTIGLLSIVLLILGRRSINKQVDLERSAWGSLGVVLSCLFYMVGERRKDNRNKQTG